MEYVLKQKGESNEEAKARRAFAVGMELYGYCRGIFGRDSYGIKTIMLIDGNNITVSEVFDVWNNMKGMKTGEVYSWKELLEASNSSLEEMEFSDGDV